VDDADYIDGAMKSSRFRRVGAGRVPTRFPTSVRQLKSLTEGDDARCVGSVETRTREELRCGLRFTGVFVCLLAAGCVGVESAPPGEPPVIGATQGGAVGAEPVIQPATPSATPPQTPPTAQSVAKADSPGTKTPLKVRASPATAERPRKKESAVPGPGKQETAPPLDLVSLEQRLRDTKAIGLFTKISLKNQVDDLLAQFRAFHQGRAGAVLTELRERYNLLLLKVLSLLQDGDPVLARAIAGSREAIWGVLADRAKFATL
jgi:hypothetical protein